MLATYFQAIALLALAAALIVGRLPKWTTHDHEQEAQLFELADQDRIALQRLTSCMQELSAQLRRRDAAPVAKAAHQPQQAPAKAKPRKRRA